MIINRVCAVLALKSAHKAASPEPESYQRCQMPTTLPTTNTTTAITSERSAERHLLASAVASFVLGVTMAEEGRSRVRQNGAEHRTPLAVNGWACLACLGEWVVLMFGAVHGEAMCSTRLAREPTQGCHSRCE